MAIKRKTRDVIMTKEQAIAWGNKRREELTKHKRRQRLLKNPKLTKEEISDMAKEYEIYKRRAMVWSRIKVVVK